MSDVKHTYREGEQAAKEASRRADGESVADDVGNAGDEVRKQLGNAGDDVSDTAGDTGAKKAWRESDGDESLADKAGNVGDDLRR